MVDFKEDLEEDAYKNYSKNEFKYANFTVIICAVIVIFFIFIQMYFSYYATNNLSNRIQALENINYSSFIRPNLYYSSQNISMNNCSYDNYTYFNFYYLNYTNITYFNNYSYFNVSNYYVNQSIN